MEFLTTSILVIGGAAAVLLFFVLVVISMMFRTVVSTNDVHIVQSFFLFHLQEALRGFHTPDFPVLTTK